MYHSTMAVLSYVKVPLPAASLECTNSLVPTATPGAHTEVPSLWESCFLTDHSLS